MTSPDTIDKTKPAERSPPLAALLAWLLPGLGHWYLGDRPRAVVFFVVTGVTFWGGVAVGGVRSTVTARENGPWIAAQLCMGTQAVAALYFGHVVQERSQDRYKAPWPASNLSVVYAGITGLLNLLIIIDALARADATQARAAARAPPGRRAS